MEKVEREQLAHDTEIDIGAPDADSAYVTLGKLRSLLADSERCERLEGAIQAARNTLSAALRMEMFDGPAIKEASAILRDALEVPDGE